MKRKIISAIAMTLLTLTAKGQSSKSTYLNLYASLGAELLSGKSFHHDSKITPGYSAIMGAGSLWNKGKILVGMEFYYGNGSKRNEVRDVAFSGQTSSLLLGYKIDVNDKLKINFLTGAGYALNHISIMDNTIVPGGGYNSTIYHYNNIIVPAAVFVQHINTNGTMIGLKAGYNFALKKNSWSTFEGEHTTTYNEKSDGFYLQLIMGGRLKLK